jgi:hypothetical protein
LVFADAKIPIGYIKEVYNSTSLVVLYSSPDEKIDAQIDGINSQVVISGRGGGNFQMSLPNELSIEPGTFVVLPNLNNQILAIVVDTISDARDPISTIVLKSPVNVQELRWVQVLK